ncbi:hypothetical protein FC40_GL001001 [Ligilactobacillus hayakitensis DSM 18933 = JCM 14209]|uniref:N-acetyltransferase domain-containing protein n=1 Tax=Ligilactobacillus hayakitensis DSM 18933 = JCM 14209 TaxID=1423755 RepID=A0A0R1WKV7_9LACO|nr:ribosomal protein S18-alanine N-acetyltransferase [Ligilactobacillus hayakitensis]KRM18321.1 hypothetical protein FC40_GL001001 [Ligilactobacillus hayakitensis DSM 18933 = JCM 14209]
MLKSLMTNFKYYFNFYIQDKTYRSRKFRPDIEIRQATIADVDQIFSIQKAAFGYAPWMRNIFIREINAKKSSLYLCVVNKGQVIGFIGINFYLFKKECHITNLAIHPTYQKQKLATQLMKEIISYCQFNNLKKITLEVSTKNLRAQNLYYKLGFKDQKLMRSYYQETGDDAILMSRDLVNKVD